MVAVAEDHALERHSHLRERLEEHVDALAADDLARVDDAVAVAERGRPEAESAARHEAQTNELMAELESEKKNLTKLFARWEELEALKASATDAKAG